MKRLFVACLLSREFQQTLEQWQDGFGDLPVRWLEGDHLHITLVPPWNEHHIDSALERLKALQGIQAFPLDLTRVAFGPDKRQPRLIWAEGTPHERLLLALKLCKRLFPSTTDRQFRLHVTLGRFKLEDFFHLSSVPLEGAVTWKGMVSRTAIIESVLGPAGSRYHILESVDLL